MSDLDYQVYVLAEIAYKNEHPDINEDELIPLEWASYDDYKTKAAIIAKAIDNHMLIEDVPEFKNTIEGIVRE